MKHKKLFISLIAVLSVIVFLAVFLLVWFVGDVYPDFEHFDKSIDIQGLDDGAVPQGIGTYPTSYTVVDEDGNTVLDNNSKPVTKTQDYFLISAYMKDKSPSRIYVTGKDTGYVGYVTLKNTDGSDFYGHCGGIATNGTVLWVTGESKVHVAKTSDSKKYATVLAEIIAKAKLSVNPSEDEGEQDISVAFTAEFNANCRASFCYYYDAPNSSGLSSDRLYVGEFYREGNYKTDDKHKMTTPEGYKNTAFMYEYNVNTSTEYGLTLLGSDRLDDANKVPRIQKIFSLPEKIQGVAWSGRASDGSNATNTNNGILVLSQSYGLANSHLLCFDFSKIIGTRKLYNTIAGENFAYEGIKTIGGNAYTDSSLYVYFTDKNDSEMFINDYSIPSMSEGMCVPTPTTYNNEASNRVYVLFESGSKKYGMFVREQIKNVYSFIPRSK